MGYLSDPDNFPAIVGLIFATLMNNLKYRSTVLILICAVLGFVLVLLATPYGIGTSPDSVIYLNAADNILSGNGVSVTIAPNQYQPLTQYPPLYPVTLAALGYFGITPYDFGRWFSGIVYALNIFLVGAVLIRLIPGSIWPALTAAMLMLFAPVMVGIHIMAWSEPLFVLFTLLCFLLLSEYFNNLKLVWIITASIFAGLAILTRFAGAAVIAACISALFLLDKKTRFILRLRNALLFILISFAPLVLVLAYNQLTTGTTTNRIISFHLISRSQLWDGLTTLTSWIGVPGDLPTWGHIIILVAVAILFLLILFRNYQSEHKNGLDVNQGFRIPTLITLLFLFVLIYGAFLIISISFFDANTPLDNRILSPIFVCLLIIVTYIISKFVLTAENQRFWKWFSIGIVISLLLTSAFHSFPDITGYQEQGIGFSSPAWQNSTLLQEVHTLPSGILFYSNIPEAITLLTKQSATRLPRKFEASSQQVNTAFTKDLQSIEQLMDTGDAVIVFFNQEGRLDNPSIDDLQKHLDLAVIYQDAYGTIYSLHNFEEK